MSKELRVVSKIATPLTKQDCEDIDRLCEDLIEQVQKRTTELDSTFARKTCEDIMDVLIDIKCDVNAWGEKEAVLMHDDGFCDPIEINKIGGSHEQFS